MKNKINTQQRFHDSIRTKHDFIEDEQIFLKKETQEVFLEDRIVAEWFPTDFKWVPDRL